jgi:hypothetical protein
MYKGTGATEPIVCSDTTGVAKVSSPRTARDGTKAFLLVPEHLLTVFYSFLNATLGSGKGMFKVTGSGHSSMRTLREEEKQGLHATRA